MMIDNIVPVCGDKTLGQAAIDGDITIHNLDNTAAPEIARIKHDHESR